MIENKHTQWLVVHARSVSPSTISKHKLVLIQQVALNQDFHLPREEEQAILPSDSDAKPT